LLKEWEEKEGHEDERAMIVKGSRPANPNHKKAYLAEKARLARIAVYGEPAPSEEDWTPSVLSMEDARWQAYWQRCQQDQERERETPVAASREALDRLRRNRSQRSPHQEEEAKPFWVPR